MKIFQFETGGEKEFYAAPTWLKALTEYCNISDQRIDELPDDLELDEIPESKWDKMKVENTEYDSSDPDDWETKTFREAIEGRTESFCIAGTMGE